MQHPIYLDYAATTPTDERVLASMLPYFTEHFGNPSSRYHAFGWQADEAVERSREQIAQLLHAKAQEIVFTGGATESINLALKGCVRAGEHIISTAVEHSAVLEVCRFLEQQGVSLTYIEPDTDGTITPQQVEAAIKPNTKLISIMAANNEIGNVYDIDAIGKLAKQHQILFHTDATQAIGKIPINTGYIDLLSFSGHKIYAPKGIGALFVRKGTVIQKQQHGAGQERNLRAGTLNVPSIVALGRACEIAASEQNTESLRIEALRNELEMEVLKHIPNVFINGNTANRLPNISNICFSGRDGETLLMRMNRIALSNGSACNSASVKPSHVLKAMKLSDEDALASIRFSLGRFTTKTDIEQSIEHVRSVLAN